MFEYELFKTKIRKKLKILGRIFFYNVEYFFFNLGKISVIAL